MAIKGRGTASKLGLPYGVGLDAGNRKKPYFAQVTVCRKRIYLGRFSTAEEACRVAADFKANYYQLNPAPPIAAPPLGVTSAIARASMLALPIRQE